MDWREAARDIPIKEYAHWTDPERVVANVFSLYQGWDAELPPAPPPVLFGGDGPLPQGTRTRSTRMRPCALSSNATHDPGAPQLGRKRQCRRRPTFRSRTCRSACSTTAGVLRGGVALGDRIIDLAALLHSRRDRRVRRPGPRCRASLVPLFACPPQDVVSALRAELSDLFRAGGAGDRRAAEAALVPMSDARAADAGEAHGLHRFLHLDRSYPAHGRQWRPHADARLGHPAGRLQRPRQLGCRYRARPIVRPVGQVVLPGSNSDGRRGRSRCSTSSWSSARGSAARSTRWASRSTWPVPSEIAVRLLPRQRLVGARHPVLRDPSRPASRQEFR